MKNYKLAKLRGRTLLAIITIVPSIVAGVGLTSYRAVKIIRGDAKAIVALETEKLEENISQWLKYNVLLLKNMSQQPDIISLDPKLQHPVLNTATIYYDRIYLAHTVNLEGTNIARSDRQPLQNYTDRLWFKGAVAGNDITEEIVISETYNKPTLCTAAPVKNSAVTISVVTVCSYLDAIAEWVEQIELGQTGIAIVVNSKGEVLAHSNPQYAYEKKLADFSEYPPVINLLDGNEETFIVTDDSGIEWIASGRVLNNSWAVITLQHTSEAFAAVKQFQVTAIAMTILTVLLVFITIWEFISTIEQEIVRHHRHIEQQEKAIINLIDRVSTVKEQNSSIKTVLDLEELSSIANLLDAAIENVQRNIEIESKESSTRILIEAISQQLEKHRE